MKFLLTFLVVAAITSPAAAQSADEMFHDGAHLFVDGKIDEAQHVVEAGLEAAPTNTKLAALLKLIEEEKEQESGSSGSQEQDEQRQEEQSEESEQRNANEGNREEDSQQESQQEQEQTGEQGKPPESESSAPDQREQGDEERQSSSGAQESSEELSRAQALRILQALQTEEEQLLREVQKVKGKPRRVEKDW